MSSPTVVAAAPTTGTRPARRRSAKTTSIVHGYAAYRRGSCKCDICKEDHRQRTQMERARRRHIAATRPDLVPHGYSGYVNWGCKCPTCSAAHRAKKAAAAVAKASRTALEAAA